MMHLPEELKIIFVFHRYGDRVAVTVPGRIFAIMWTLYGLVITGILVGNLTSALTASVAFTLNEVDLYQAQVIDRLHYRQIF